MRLFYFYVLAMIVQGVDTRKYYYMFVFFSDARHTGTPSVHYTHGSCKCLERTTRKKKKDRCNRNRLSSRARPLGSFCGG